MSAKEGGGPFFKGERSLEFSEISPFKILICMQKKAYIFAHMPRINSFSGRLPL